MSNDFITPSNPADQKKIADAVVEAFNSRQRIAAEKDLIKNIRDDLKEKFGLPPKVFNKMLTTYEKMNLEEQVQETAAFTDVYVAIMKDADTTVKGFTSEQQ